MRHRIKAGNVGSYTPEKQESELMYKLFCNVSRISSQMI